MTDRSIVAVFAGPTATIQNTPPLVTSTSEHIIRAQRLAAPAVVYVEALSAHPMERDAATLYAPPDGYLDDEGTFVPAAEIPPGRTGVHRVVLRPSDGLYGLPYVARTRDGEPWEHAGLTEGSDFSGSRQTFYPDATRLYEEIDRFGLDVSGRGGLLSKQADFEFFRPAPSAGYTTAEGARAGGLAGPEVHGSDFFNYYPRHLRAEPDAAVLVRATNMVQEALGSDRFTGGQWLEGSPFAEETLYWMNLLVDTKVPLVGHAAQRPHGTLSADGDRNIVDGVRYLTSRVWADADGVDRVGAVMIVDEVVYAAREVAKTDARPGNYVATGGHGGIVGSTGVAGEKVELTYVPVRRHTHCSDLRLTVLPRMVGGVTRTPSGRWMTTTLRVTSDDGRLAPEAMPAVSIMKHGRYSESCCSTADLTAWIEHVAAGHPLAGVVGEGSNPYGGMDPAFESVAKSAAFAGLPVVLCGRGNTQGFAAPKPPWFISGSNLTSTKARVLLMACLLRFGALPPAVDPAAPTPEEHSATAEAVARYQKIFDTH
jgi:L-asparaginase